MRGRRRRKRPVYTPDFLRFWAAYPRKVKKPHAAVAWLDQEPEIEVVLDALNWQTRDPEWLEEGGKFIPHPASYINARRWEDEKPAATNLRVLSDRERGNQHAFSAFVARGAVKP